MRSEVGVGEGCPAVGVARDEVSTPPLLSVCGPAVRRDGATVGGLRVQTDDVWTQANVERAWLA